MNLFLLLGGAYLVVCWIVTEYKKVRDPRYHYAANRDPEGQRFGSVILRHDDKMVSAPTSVLTGSDRQSIPIRIRRHPRPRSPVLPDGVWNLIVRCVGYVSLRRYTAFLCLTAIGCGLLLHWAQASASADGPSSEVDRIFAGLDAMRSYGWAALLGFAGLVLATDVYMCLRIPSRSAAGQFVHRSWRFLTFRPNPEPDPTLARRVAAAREASNRDALREDREMADKVDSLDPGVN